MNQTPPGVRPFTFAEDAILSAYKETVKTAFDSADTAAQTILTAAFSIATAYGALIGLVAPKDAQNPLLVGAPFVGFAVAAVTAMVSRMLGAPLSLTNDAEEVMTAITDTVRQKRVWSGVSIVAMVVALGVGGAVVIAAYGESETAAPLSLELALTSELEERVISLCEETGALPIEAQRGVAIEGDFVTIEVPAGACKVRSTTLRLPARFVRALLTEG